MEGWLTAAKEAAEAKAALLQEQAASFQQQASQLAADVGTSLSGTSRTGGRDEEGAKQFVFKPEPLGFTLGGLYVDKVQPNSQAAKLGIQVGDQILSVAGYPVPAPRSMDDAAGAEKAGRLVKQWIKETPRPATFVFLPGEVLREREAAAKSAEAEVAVSAAEAAAQATAAAEASAATPRGTSRVEVARKGEDKPLESPPTRGVAGASLAPSPAEFSAERELTGGLQGDMLLLQEDNQSLRRELEEARSFGRGGVTPHGDGDPVVQVRLETQVRKLQEQLAMERTKHDVALKQAALLEAKLAAAEARCQDLRKVLERSEDRVHEAFESRERILEDEVDRMRKQVTQAEARCQATIKATEEASAEMVAAVEERISELEASLARKSQEAKDTALRLSATENAGREAVVKLRAEHANTLAEQREAHEGEVRELRRQDRARACEVEMAKKELVKAKKSTGGGQSLDLFAKGAQRRRRGQGGRGRGGARGCWPYIGGDKGARRRENGHSCFVGARGLSRRALLQDAEQA